MKKQIGICALVAVLVLVQSVAPLILWHNTPFGWLSKPCIHGLLKADNPVFLLHLSQYFSSRNCSIPIYWIPLSSCQGSISSLTTTIFLKES